MPSAENSVGIDVAEDGIIGEEIVAQQASRHAPGGWQAMPRLQAVSAPCRGDAAQSAGADARFA